MPQRDGLRSALLTALRGLEPFTGLASRHRVSPLDGVAHGPTVAMHGIMWSWQLERHLLAAGHLTGLHLALPSPAFLGLPPGHRFLRREQEGIPVASFE